MIHTDVCIVGAGPAGLTTAMKLNELGIDCILTDKATFPRDKVCGECFDGHVYHILNRLNPNYLSEMEQTGIILKSWDYGFSDEHGRKVKTNFDRNATPRILTKRTDFDTFLIEKARAMPHVKIMEGVEFNKVSEDETGILLETPEQQHQIKAKLVVAATGNMSKFQSQLSGIEEPKGDAYTFVRGYYENVAPIMNKEVVFHIFYDPMLILYICPLPNGITSVELGGKQDRIKKYGVNLRHKLEDLLNNFEPVKPLFSNAKRVENLKGAVMHLSYRTPKLSGERYLLVGSAGTCINPVTGFGVGHAMSQGEEAAKVIAAAVQHQNFSAKFLKQYDKAVHKRLGDEVKIGKLITFIFDNPKVCLPLLFKIGNSLNSIFTDENFAKGFLNPAFYLKHLKA